MQALTLTKVLHVPFLSCNLLSLNEWLDTGSSHATFMNKEVTCCINDEIWIGSRRKNGLYTVELERVARGSSTSPEACLLADAVLSHRRFGHVDLSKVDSVEYPDAVVKDCDACIRGKFRRLPFNGKPPPVTEPLAQVNADLFGPTRVPSCTGARYLCVFIDVATSHVKVYHLKVKSQATEAFKSYRRWAENQTGKRIKLLHTDGGGEFSNQEMKEYCNSRGIEHRLNIPCGSTQNAYAERRIGIIINDTRTLLIDSGLPAEYWGYASAHSVYLRNRIGRQGRVSPHELLLKRKPRLDHLRVFGCAAYTWLPQVHRELGKLNARAELTVFLGFEEGTSNSLLVDRNNGRFLRARDVRFVEDRFLQKVTKFQPLTSSMFSGRESKKQNIKEVNRQQSQWEQEKSKNR
jgi:transposase InsO family protein